MSKVQVDTIVDKDDISAPTLSKGAIVTGVCTATTFVGAVTGDVTGNATGLTGSPNITVTDVNATGVTTTGIGTVTTSVVVGSAVTANSDGVITSGIITASSFAGDGSALTGITQTTINNNANNLVITGSGTANTLEAESQFTYDGTNLQLKKTGSSDYNEIIQDANPSTENSTLGYLSGYWNTTRVADIRFAAGDDTSNKDNAHICFRTTNAGSGSITDRLRIGNLGQIGLPVGGVGVAATDWGSSGQVLTSGGSSAVPTWADAGGGISEIDAWTISGSWPNIASTWSNSRLGDNANQAGTGILERNAENNMPVGTGMTHTDGLFTFPSAGTWQIDCNLYLERKDASNCNGLRVDLSASVDGSGMVLISTEQDINSYITHSGINLTGIMKFTNTGTTNFYVKLNGSGDVYIKALSASQNLIFKKLA